MLELRPTTLGRGAPLAHCFVALFFAEPVPTSAASALANLRDGPGFRRPSAGASGRGAIRSFYHRWPSDSQSPDSHGLRSRARPRRGGSRLPAPVLARAPSTSQPRPRRNRNRPRRGGVPRSTRTCLDLPCLDALGGAIRCTSHDNPAMKIRPAGAHFCVWARRRDDRAFAAGEGGGSRRRPRGIRLVLRLIRRSGRTPFGSARSSRRGGLWRVRASTPGSGEADPGRSGPAPVFTDELDDVAIRRARNEQVLHHDGDLAHIASGDGDTIKRNGRGVLKLCTLAAGGQDYAYASIDNQKDPVRGRLILTPSAG